MRRSEAVLDSDTSQVQREEGEEMGDAAWQSPMVPCEGVGPRVQPPGSHLAALRQPW